MIVRQEAASDRAAVRALVTAAFGCGREADLIDALRRDGDLVVSLVAERNGDVVGHVVLSRLRSPERALALAPLAVSASWRQQGVGAELVCRAIERARLAAAVIVFVLGDPAYYARFGFSAVKAAPYPSAYAGPHFMALGLGDEAPPAAAVIYAPAFDALA